MHLKLQLPQVAPLKGWELIASMGVTLQSYNLPAETSSYSNPPTEDTLAPCLLAGRNHQSHLSYPPSPSDGTGYLLSSGNLEFRLKESLL